VIGVVGSVRQWSLAEEPQPEIYISYLQQPGVTPSNYSTTRLHKSLVVRTSFLSKGLADSIYEAVVEIDKDLPVYGVKTVQQMLASSTVWQRFYAQLLGTFAAVALLLAGDRYLWSDFVFGD
jgi:hypothetical protein